MSFLIDPPWLYAHGRAIARAGRPAPVSAGTTRTHAVSAAISATYPLWPWLGYRRGRR